MYAIYQQGYAVFGVGDRPESAADDALEWLDQPLQTVYSDTGDGGWSLHDAQASEFDIACGDAPALVTGYGEPAHEDRIRALLVLTNYGRRGVDGDLICVPCSSALYERVRTEGGDQLVDIHNDGVLHLADEVEA